MSVAGFKRGFGLAVVLTAAASAALAQPTCDAFPHGVAKLRPRISVQGSGRGFTQPAVTALISRAVGLAEAAAGSGGRTWSFVLKAGGDNRPTTLVVGEVQDREHRPVCGFFRSASLGTAPPIVFVEEMQQFARRLISEEHQQTS
jgi:hypothetical protein